MQTLGVTFPRQLNTTQDIMADNEKGYVYILTNPSFREDWVKIGKSARAVNIRSKELDNTAVPLPFEIFTTIETKKNTPKSRNSSTKPSTA